MNYCEDIKLSKKFDSIYKKLLKCLSRYTTEDLNNKNLFECLYYNVDICSKISGFNMITLYHITHFLHNVINVYNKYPEIYNFLHKYNYMINEIDEYKLFCVNYKDKDISDIDVTIFNLLKLLYKRAIYELVFFKIKLFYNDLPIDALMVAKGNLVDFNRKNILKEEIYNSSFARKNQLTIKQIKNYTEEELINLHKMCKEYAFNSIANSLFNVDEHYKVIDMQEAMSYLVRRIDIFDVQDLKVDLEKDRYSLNCSVITPLTPDVYPPVFKKVILGYSNISKDNLLFVSAYDAFTEEYDKDMELSKMTGTNNMLLDIDDLNMRTYLNGAYNEIVLIRENINPSYILVRNKVDKESFDFAREKDIPLVKIRTKEKICDRDVLYPYIKKFK